MNWPPLEKPDAWILRGYEEDGGIAVSPILVDVQLFQQNVHDQMLNESKIVVAGVSPLAGGVWVTVRATVVALIHPPVVSECAQQKG